MPKKPQVPGRHSKFDPVFIKCFKPTTSKCGDFKIVQEKQVLGDQDHDLKLYESPVSGIVRDHSYTASLRRRPGNLWIAAQF